MGQIMGVQNDRNPQALLRNEGLRRAVAGKGGSRVAVAPQGYRHLPHLFPGGEEDHGKGRVSNPPLRRWRRIDRHRGRYGR